MTDSEKARKQWLFLNPHLDDYPRYAQKEKIWNAAVEWKTKEYESRRCDGCKLFDYCHFKQPLMPDLAGQKAVIKDKTFHCSWWEAKK